jgi:hypothetical protein
MPNRTVNFFTLIVAGAWMIGAVQYPTAVALLRPGVICVLSTDSTGQTGNRHGRCGSRRTY